NHLVVPTLQTETEAEAQTQDASENNIWRFRGSDKLFDLCSAENKKTLLPLGHGDPAVYPCFRTSIHVENSVVDVIRSGKGNSYGPAAGILPARHGLEFRKFDLLPEKEWEIDLQGIEAMSDENTVAMVIINPNNPCGNVAETARKLGIMVIADEVYRETIYGDNPFVPMGKFSLIAPVITLGSISKGWIVPGWRIGWIALNDPRGLLKSTGVAQSIQHNIDINPEDDMDFCIDITIHF
ncbi:unnamed protein product, partial [Brassica oleracea]